MRVDRQNDARGFFDNMSDRPIYAVNWEYFDIVGLVDPDAQILNIGMVFLGDGKAWLDDVSVTDLGPPITSTESARPLNKRALTNVIAFTRLLGYVRHFYPGDEAFKANWNELAVTGMRSVESSRNTEELLERLRAFFEPVAPALKVYKTSERQAAAASLKPPNNYKSLKVTSYRHNGFGQGVANSPYHSDRIVKAVADMAANDDAIGLMHPYAADLGGGVSCLVPLSVFTDEQGTLPRGTYKRDSEKELLISYSGNDRATRLADVALIWNVVQHFYPYFDVEKVDWRRSLADTLTKAAVDADETAFLKTLQHMIAGLNDGHGGAYFSRDNNTFPLPVIFDRIEGRLVIMNAVAEHANGLKPGDVVVKVNNKPAARVLEELEENISAATPQWKLKRALETLRYGPKNSEVVLEVVSGTDRPRTVTVRRDAEYRSLEEIRPQKVSEVRPGIFYVDIGRVTDDDLRSALPQLEKAKGVIFDLRGYPNVSTDLLTHLTDKPIQSARWMVPIITAPDQSGTIEYETGGRWNLEPKSPKLSGKIAFLTDGRAVSYAESYMGIIEAYHLASIVGETTAGTNGNINPVKLPGGYTVIWTGMKVLKHDGSQHHGIGIKPTDPVSRTVRSIASGKDEQLDAAIEIVSR
jgi:C-terminal processing protease CtpA/Prc